MINLLIWALHPVSEEGDDMVGFVGIDLAQVIDPSAGSIWITRFEGRAGGTD